MRLVLEGKFKSAYANRIEKSSYPNFKAESADNKMIVIADGDVGKNEVWKGKPLPLGEDMLTKQTYGNAQFLQNSLDFLLDDSNLMTLRNRNIEARLLDERIDDEKSYWQWFNLLPLGILALLGGLFYWSEKGNFLGIARNLAICS
ncbi:Gldg family protein [Halpernia sp. GG3]